MGYQSGVPSISITVISASPLKLLLPLISFFPLPPSLHLMDADVVGTTLFEGIGSIENSDWSDTDLSKCKFMYHYLDH